MLRRAGDRCPKARHVASPHDRTALPVPAHRAPRTSDLHRIPATCLASPKPTPPAATAAGGEPQGGTGHPHAHPAGRDVPKLRDMQHPNACKARRELAQTPKHPAALYPRRAANPGRITLGILQP